LTLTGRHAYADVAIFCLPCCSAGLGQIDHKHLEKFDGELGMLVVKIGGPAYRIGMGGGAASSVPSGSNSADLDFNAVQRGDAEMAQKLWRVVRSCVELGGRNPIVQIHDQVGVSQRPAAEERRSSLCILCRLHWPCLGDSVDLNTIQLLYTNPVSAVHAKPVSAGCMRPITTGS
jgi:hypothetical protein